MAYDPEQKAQRDRQLAAKPRPPGWRTDTIGDLATDFLKSEEVRRMKRFSRVRGCIDRVLPAHQARKVQAVSLKDGLLVLAVADSVLLGELRSHAALPLLTALGEDQTGVTRLAWRVQRG
jgi:hypothetical protein